MEALAKDAAAGQAALNEVVVRLLAPNEKERWDSLMRAHHYLGFEGFIGKSLRYIAEAGDQWLALIGWQAAALKCGARDRWIGWPAVLQYRRLHLIANNCRFLILPEAHHRNLASRVLALNLRRISADWQVIHGAPLLLAETFVDPDRFTGACYKAANWLVLGQTRGFAKRRQTYRRHGSPKLALVYPLHRRARALLVDPQWQPRSAEMNPKALTAKQLESLQQLLKSAPDPRSPRGVRHRSSTVLTIALAAVLCGAKSFLEIGEYAESLTGAQLKRLGCRFDKKTGRHEPPSESTLRRVLQDSDAEGLDRELGRWIGDQAGEKKAVAVDGKTSRGARRADGAQVHLLSAFLHQQGATIAQIEVGAKTNEIPEIKRLLEPLDVEGVVITADAMHTQHETARFIVEEKKADYLFTVKANQPGLLADIAALEESDFSPGVPDGR